MSVEQIIALNAALADLGDLYVAARRFTALQARAESAFLPALTGLGRRLRALTHAGQLSDETVAEAARDILGLSAHWSAELQRVRDTPEYRRAHAAVAADDQRTLDTAIPRVFAGLLLRPSPPVLYAPFSPSSGHRKPGTSPFLDPADCADKIVGLLQNGIAPEIDPGAWWQQELPAFTCVDDPAGVDTPIALSFDPAARRCMKEPLSALRQAQGERKSSIKSGRGSAHAEPVEAWGGVFQEPGSALAVFEHAAEQTCVVFAQRLVGPFSVTLSDDATDEWWTAYDNSYRDFRDALERALSVRDCRVRRVTSAARDDA